MLILLQSLKQLCQLCVPLTLAILKFLLYFTHVHSFVLLKVSFILWQQITFALWNLRQIKGQGQKARRIYSSRYCSCLTLISQTLAYFCAIIFILRLASMQCTETCNSLCWVLLQLWLLCSCFSWLTKW